MHLPGRLAVIVAAVSLVVTLAAWRTVTVVTANEQHRLLRVQSAQAAEVISVAIEAVEGPLETGLQVAVATGGDPARFADFEAHYVGPTKTFAYFAVMVNGRVVLHDGGTPLLDPSSPTGEALAAKAMATGAVTVAGLSPGHLGGVGYAAGQRADGTGYVVYAERLISPNRMTTAEQDPAFGDLRFATYIGDSTSTADLTTTDVQLAQLPIRGYAVRKTIPFGDNAVTLVTAARGSLGGALIAYLGFVFLGVGLVLTLIATAVADLLVRRRRAAEEAGARVADLYEQLDQRFYAQREVAETLQRALLPEKEPEVPGLATASRYVAGSVGVDIGGDWYGLVRLDNDRFAFVVGDVSGRGVEAAAIMARLRFTLLAYLIEGHAPDTALTMGASHISIEQDGHFATALVGVGSVRHRTISIANAGHLAPIVVRGGHAWQIDAPCGPPLGTVTGATYPASETVLEPGDELILFTDGLVERREDSLEAGLARLQDAVCTPDASLDEKVARVVAELAGEGSEDDIAVLALAWPID